MRPRERGPPRNFAFSFLALVYRPNIRAIQCRNAQLKRYSARPLEKRLEKGPQISVQLSVTFSWTCLFTTVEKKRLLTITTMSTTNIETEAIIVAKPGDDFKLSPIILDEVRGNEVLVEMKYSGICHTVSLSRAREGDDAKVAAGKGR